MATNEVQPSQTRQKLVESAKKCIRLFEDIQTNIMDVDHYKYPLALTSQHLPGSQASMSVPLVFKKRLDQLKQWTIRVLVAGDISAGKSTLLNLVMGDTYLPVKFQRATFVMCEIEDTFYNPEKTAKVQYAPSESGHGSDEVIAMDTDPGHDSWKDLQRGIKTKKYKDKKLKRVLIKWPLILQEDWHQTPVLQPYVGDSTDTTAPSTDIGPSSRDNTNPITRDRADTLSDRPSVAGDEIDPFPNKTGFDVPRQKILGKTLRQKKKMMIDQIEKTCTEDKMSLRDNFRVTFVDTPGITDRTDEEREVFDEVSTSCDAYKGFIFVIKADAVDIRREGLQALMEEIENSIRQRSDVMNPECVLFIVNKYDLVPDDEREEFANNIKGQLLRKWPRISERNIIFMSAKENKLYYNDSHQEFPDRIQEYVNEVIRLSLEEHCLWLLNLFEVTCAIMKAGKNWVSARNTKNQLKLYMSQLLTEASALSTRLDDTPADFLDKVYEETSKEFQHCLNFSLRWDKSEIDRHIPKLDIDWNDLREQIDTMILDRISKAKEDDLKRLRQKFERGWKEKFKPELDIIQRLTNSLDGLAISEEGKTNITEGIATALAPVALSGAIRVAPLAAPFLFLAFPVLPIPLLIKMFYDEYKDYTHEQLRKSLKDNRVEFFKKRTNDIVQVFKKAFHNTRAGELRKSPLFSHLFGINPKEVLTKQVDEIIDTIKMLNNVDLKNEEEYYRLCNGFLARTMQIYTDGILEHDIRTDRLTFDRNNRNGGGDRIRLGNDRSVVYQAKLDNTVEVAVKELQYKGNTSSRPEDSIQSDLDVYRECFMLRQLSRTPCDNLIKYLGSGFISEDVDGSTSCTLLLVFERCDRTLNDVIGTTLQAGSAGDKQRKEFKWYTGQILMGLKFLHDRNIVHRDMKPSNCLLKQSDGGLPIVKIADVGAAKQKDLICTTARNRGTFAYWAPEIVRSSRIVYHSKSSDVYSLGLILWELWYRKLAYREFNIMGGEVPTTLPNVGEVKQILNLCLNKNPYWRASVDYLLQLPFLQ